MEETRYRVISSTPDALKALPVPMYVQTLRRADSFTISVRQVNRYQRGRVFLAGDAAHCHSPVGGRGMNRHTAGQHVLAFSERDRRIMQSTNPATRCAVRTAMHTFGKVPALGRVALNQLVNG